MGTSPASAFFRAILIYPGCFVEELPVPLVRGAEHPPQTLHLLLMSGGPEIVEEFALILDEGWKEIFRAEYTYVSAAEY
ncbi:hypothetical protein ACEXQB_008995 [Herbiconiux sp. P18]|uniref:hypothetical protein n=1 Tax=Herbiconiux liangxiaofengii TaxID=3342795 RepID=UPI0035BB7F36